MEIPDLSGTSAAGNFDPLPNDWYNVRVLATEERLARTGTPGINLTLEVIDGAHAKRRIWDTIWVTEQALGFVKQKLEALGLQIPNGGFDLNPQTLVGRRCAVKTEQEVYDGKTQTRVKAYDKIAGSDLPTGPDWREMLPEAGGDDDLPFG